MKLALLNSASFAMLCAAGLAVAETQTQRPNILVFLTDDQSQLDCTPYGEAVIRTPNMQQLADQGMTFTRAFVASPSCAPSRAALLTGLMPARNGAEPNHSKPRAEIKKWPAYFQELGYEVVAFGKVSHYKHTKDYGFDYFAFDGFHEHQSIGAARAIWHGGSQHEKWAFCICVAVSLNRRCSPRCGGGATEPHPDFRG